MEAYENRVAYEDQGLRSNEFRNLINTDLGFVGASLRGRSILECGGKRSATPLWIVYPKNFVSRVNPKRRRRFALPAHSKKGTHG